MSLKAGLLLITLFIGSHAFPTQKQDMSVYFDYTDSSSRIVGGTVAGRVPFMVALTTGVLFKNLFCGGSLITNRHVLTAGHCIEAVFNEQQLLNSLRVTVGSNRWDRGGTQYRIASNITHPDYSLRIVKNDIGFLITRENVIMSTTVQPAVLSYDFVGAGVPTSVTGWGATSVGGMPSVNLMQLSAHVFDGTRCVTEMAHHASQFNFSIPAPEVDPLIEICTLKDIGHGACNRDSGGPLMRSDRQQQIGVVSWGMPCAVGAPDVFTRISAFGPWIEQSLREVLYH